MFSEPEICERQQCNSATILDAWYKKLGNHSTFAVSGAGKWTSVNLALLSLRGYMSNVEAQVKTAMQAALEHLKQELKSSAYGGACEGCHARPSHGRDVWAT